MKVKNLPNLIPGDIASAEQLYEEILLHLEEV